MLLSDPATLMSRLTGHQVFLIPRLGSGVGIHALVQDKRTVPRVRKLGSGPRSRNLLWDLEEVTKLLALVSFSFNDISSLMIPRLFHLHSL